jgi:ABC-type branched-subunit amino acid transport system permease subunit
METIIIVGAVAAVVGFIVGILVGRANSKTVTTAIADVKGDIAALKTDVSKLFGGSKTASTPTTGSSAISGSK